MPLVLLLAVFLMSGSAHAQVDAPVDMAAERLADVLSNLKNSAEKLSRGNADLATQNGQLRDGIDQINQQLRKLGDENAGLNRSWAKLEENNPVRAKRIAELENQVFTLDNSIDHLTQQMKADNDLIAGAGPESQRLSRHWQDLTGEQLAPVPAAVTSDDSKEKLQLLKMIDESKKRQEDLYNQIADARSQKPIKAVISVQTPEDREALINQAARLEEEISQLSKPANALPGNQQVWSQEQLNALEDQVAALQKNHDELQDLVNKMLQKAQKKPLSGDQRTEQLRLKQSLADLNKESKKLKEQLNNLRKKMVDLDKRKSLLESQNAGN